MSGHAGIYYYDRRPLDRSLGERLGAGLSRQGPDGGSERFGDGLLMVYRAFRVEPESYLETQPYVSPRGNWMTWDGRLDNRDDLLLLVKDQLEDDTTDVALAMAAYEKWGEPGFNRLIGDWSLALWDKANESAILASDYLGVRPLYYFASNDCIAWSSDLGQLVSWFGVEDDLDNHYIAAFLTHSPKNNRTIYRPISFVPCAHSVKAKDRNVTKTPFWFPPVESRIRYQTDGEYEEHLLHCFREAVLRRLRTNHPVCCDLSGGLDSSSVTCMAHLLIHSGVTPRKQLTTLSLIDPDMDDERYIRVVEEHCRIVGIHARFSQLWSLDVPSSPMPSRTDLLRRDIGEALLCKAIRSHLTGLGGDLVMGNILEDTDQLADAFRDRNLVRLLREAYAWGRVLRIPIWLTLRLGMIPLFSASRQQKMWKEKNILLCRAYGNLKKTSIVNTEFIDHYVERVSNPYNLLYRRAIPSVRGFLHAISSYQTFRPLTIRLDQLNPIKSTHPFCDRSLVEYVAAIPRQQLCGIGNPRHLMRRALRGILPPALLKRRTKALSSSASDKSLLEILPELSNGQFQAAVRGFIDGVKFRRVLQHPQATDYDRNQLMQVMTLEIWLRTRRSDARVEAQTAVMR
jgi:asparagine synthase (glutamine-hydrolysing)